MEDAKVARVQDLLTRRLKDMSVSQLGDAAALRGLSVEIVRALHARRRASSLNAVTAATATSTAPSFREAAQAFIGLHQGTWRNAEHGEQWFNTLRDYAYPLIGDLPITDVDVELITRILDPIWTKKTETASRVRDRIERILDWSTVRGYRSGPNPARWDGHLQMVFPSRFKVRRVRHHPALPFVEISPLHASIASGKLNGRTATRIHYPHCRTLKRGNECRLG